MKQENILEVLVKNDFDLSAIENLKDNITLNINTKDYDMRIDANIASNIVKYQNIIYTIYCLGKYGSADLRKLTLDERSQLGLKFKIEKGSTDYLADAKEILQMFIDALPESQKMWGVIVLAVTISGIFGGYLYYRYKESKLAQTTLIDKEETTRLAIQKLADIASNNPTAKKGIGYAMEIEKEMAQNYEESNSDIVINGEVYTKKRMEEIVKEYSKRLSKPEVKPTSRNIKGRYTVTNIETVAPYRLTLKNNKEKPINPTYNPEFLDDNMLNEVKRAVSSAIPVEFDFDINISTDSKGQEHYSIIKINKASY